MRGLPGEGRVSRPARVQLLNAPVQRSLTRATDVSGRLRTMARWRRENGIHVKGHPVVRHEGFPKWIGGSEPMEPLIEKRIAETIGGFKGLVDW
jgi:hypothetical protein